jgi:hypothetical protein
MKERIIKMSLDRGERAEKISYDFILSLDKEAILYGGMDSTKADIYSPIYGWVEVKDLTKGARCGQFTENTKNLNSFAVKLIKNPNEENCKGFVKEHYTNKEVKYICVVINENPKLLSLSDFLNTYSFSLQNYKKNSGTRSCPKKDFERVLKENSSFYEKEGKIYSSDLKLYKTYFYIEDNKFYIGKNNEVRKCGKTKNLTWLIEVKNVKIN